MSLKRKRSSGLGGANLTIFWEGTYRIFHGYCALSTLQHGS